MMMTEIEILKKTIGKQTCAIVNGLKTEFDKRNIGGDTYQATMVLEEAKRAHDMMCTKISSINRKVNGIFVYDNPEFRDFFQIEDGEALGKLNDKGRDKIIQEDNGESQPRGLVISWNNCRYGRISLLPRNYVFPSITLTNLLKMCYCGDRSKNIPPYLMTRGSDMKDMKGGIQKLSMVKKSVKNIEKGVRIVNLPHLLVQNWTPRHFLD